MTGPPTYILDANVFIEAARRYYAFDIAPAFWQALVNSAGNGQVLSIDHVKKEIIRKNDELKTWANGDFNSGFVPTADKDVIGAYGQVIEWVSGHKQFDDAAKAQFADGADGWIIAYAMAKGCIVVTQEQFNPDIKRRVPIPNVCRQFGVQYVDTFQMLRDLGVKLA